MSSAYALDELDRVLGNERLRSPGARRGGRSGPWDEYDVLRQMSRRTIRRLIGAGYLRRRGAVHDEVAEIILARVPGLSSPDEAISWYCTTALVAIGEARREARARVYRRRVRRAHAAGYRSFHHQRVSRIPSR